LEPLSVSNALVSYNIFYDNVAERFGGAIMCHDQSDPQLDHNLIYNNSGGLLGGALEIQNSCNPVLINNTIADNMAAESGGGIDVMEGSSPMLINTILWNNRASDTTNQVNINDPDCAPDFYYCDIQGGASSFWGNPHTGAYDSCFDADPEFEYPSSGLYGLMNCSYFPVSPCINAGDPDPIYNDPDGSRNDMGAMWPPITCSGIQEKSYNSLFVYPNPTVGMTKIEYVVGIGGTINNPSVNDVTIRLGIFSVVGNEVLNLVNRIQPAGEYEVLFNASGLPEGIYLIRLQAGPGSAARKLVKL